MPSRKACSIYVNRPDMCVVFPARAKQIREFPQCGFYFEDGQRKGKCNGCGACCCDMPWNADGSATVGRCKNKDKICRYLK